MAASFLADSELRQAYKVFFNCINSYYDGLELAISIESREEIKKFSHKIKGSSFCYGYQNLSSISESIYCEASKLSPSYIELSKKFELLKEEHKKISSDNMLIESLD